MIKKVVTPRHKLKSKDMGKNQNCLDSKILLYTLFEFFFFLPRDLGRDHGGSSHPSKQKKTPLRSRLFSWSQQLPRDRLGCSIAAQI